MEQIANLMSSQGIVQTDCFNREDYLKSKAQSYNDSDGKLTDFNCDKCKNKGDIAVIKNNDVVFVYCDCWEKRKTLRRLKNSGLLQQIEDCTFDNFKTDYDYQKTMKNKALEFLKDNDKWFIACGQVGCGKTHICTAIVGELINKGYSARYMLWRDEIVKLKAVVNDDSEYSKLINQYKTCKVLYIDDLFKGKITEADINIAFEIINFRYTDKSLITILSGEKLIDELMEVDQAIASRINQKN